MKLKLDVFRTSKKGYIRIHHIDVDIDELEPMIREEISSAVDYSPEDKIEINVASIET